MAGEQSANAGVKQTTALMRWTLLITSALPFLAGLSLFVGTNMTDEWSAWTIDSAITAAAIGGAYWGAFFIKFMSGLERIWARARVAVSAGLTFTVFNFIATVIHSDKFHTDSDRLTTQIVTYLWLVPYFAGISLGVAIIVHQLRAPGVDPPRVAPLPGWLKGVLGIQAAVMAGVGAALFIAPADTADNLWPWELTPLTARVVAAWLLALAVGAFHVVLENDWARSRPAAVTFALIAVLEFVVLARYSDAVDWGSAGPWIYFGFLLSMLEVGLYSWWRASRVLSDEEAPRGPRPAPAPSA